MMLLKILLIAVTTLLLASPAPSRTVWKLVPAGLELVMFPPAAIKVAAPLISADLDGDDQPEDLRISTDLRAEILSGARLRWQSPPAWQVRQALIADLNHDGRLEAVLLVWREFKPWPVDAWLPNGGRINGFHDKSGRSCHLILNGWVKNAFRERWAGSALAEPILEFAAADLSGSGKQNLITLDSDYDVPAGTPAKHLKVWEWNGFGFSVVSKVEGLFHSLSVSQPAAGQVLIFSP
jgi:hypothetical protein